MRTARIEVHEDNLKQFESKLGGFISDIVHLGSGLLEVKVEYKENTLGKSA